jgi:hypothetical protein
VVVGEDCETSVEVSLPEIVSTTSSGSIIAAASNKNLCSSARSKVAGRFLRSVGFSRCVSDAPIDRPLPYSKYCHFVIKRERLVVLARTGRSTAFQPGKRRPILFLYLERVNQFPSGMLFICAKTSEISKPCDLLTKIAVQSAGLLMLTSKLFL